MKRTQDLLRILPALMAVALGMILLPPAALAKGPPPQVSEADPPVGEQGSTGLNIAIIGKNFDIGAQVRFFVTGTTNPGGVKVNSVAFVNSNRLVANIDIDDVAEVAAFDIEVELLSGRKGKGTEKFAVLEKGSGGPQAAIPLCVTFRNDPGDLLRSDTLSETYCDSEERNLRALLGNTFGVLNLNTPKSSREVIMDIPDCPRLIGGDCSGDGALATLNEWEDTGLGLVALGEKLDLRAMDEGTTRYADFQIAFPSQSKSTPHLVVFGGTNHYPCGEPLPVTRLDEDTWIIAATSESACLVEVISKNNREITRVNFPLPFQITLFRE